MTKFTPIAAALIALATIAATPALADGNITLLLNGTSLQDERTGHTITPYGPILGDLSPVSSAILR